MKHFFSFLIMQLFVLTITAQYVDLGLPSGTKWKIADEIECYTYNETIKFGSALPTMDQWNELYDNCDWEWIGTAYKIVGPNGNSIELPVSACDVSGKGSGFNVTGSYWSSNVGESGNAHCFGFSSGAVLRYSVQSSVSQSVRLVQSK